jgi:YgiT-type zinc finger domain-containing protein
MTNETLKITKCPTCNSDKIRRVRRDWQGECRGKRYRVRNLTFYECPACGESVYDREAMRRIEACSPAFAKSRSTA